MAQVKKPNVHELVSTVLCNVRFAQEKHEADQYTTVSKELTDLFQSLTALKKAQWPSVLPAVSDDRFDKFKAWLKENNVDLEKQNIEIATNLPEGNGIRATAAFKQGDPVVEVPRKLMMTVDSVDPASALAPLLQKDQLLSPMPSVGLALLVLCELLKKGSFWRPYLDVLPRDIPLPLFWSFEEICAIDNAPVRAEVFKLIVNATMQYCYIYNLLLLDNSILKPSRYTFEGWLWAVAVIMSRQNEVPRIPKPTTDESKTTETTETTTTTTTTTTDEPKERERTTDIALIPVWDMFNHTSGKITTYFETEKQALCCEALADYAAGDQVYIYYGDRPNTQFLLYQGFVFAENNSDEMFVSLALPNSDLNRAKNRVLATSSNHKSCVYILRYDQQHSERLLSFLRFAAATKEEFATILRANKDGLVQQISVENEKRALGVLFRSVQALLKYRYPETSTDTTTTTTTTETKEKQFELDASKKQLMEGLHQAEKRILLNSQASLEKAIAAL